MILKIIFVYYLAKHSLTDGHAVRKTKLSNVTVLLTIINENCKKYQLKLIFLDFNCCRIIPLTFTREPHSNL